MVCATCYFKSFVGCVVRAVKRFQITFLYEISFVHQLIKTKFKFVHRFCWFVLLMNLWLLRYIIRICMLN